MEQISDNVLAEAYQELNSVWKVGDKFGISGQSVHSRLTKLGVIHKLNYWTAQDDEALKAKYLEYRNAGKLAELASQFKRTKPFIVRQAKRLGLTDNVNHISMKPFAEVSSQRMKKYFAENEHPRGMLGKKHTEEVKAKLSQKSSEMWKDPNCYLNSEQYRDEVSMRVSLQHAYHPQKENMYSRSQKGYVEVGGKIYFYRSSWEPNVAAYLEFLKQKGEIKEWEYEPDVFWFDNIKRGVRSYRPDFKVYRNDESFYYIEVKGWMDDKSKTKMKRMRIYYPEVEIEILGNDRYKEISKMAPLIPEWGKMGQPTVKDKEPCKIDGCKNTAYKKGVCRKHYNKLP